MFNAVDTEVHLVDNRAQIMSNEDRDISDFIKDAFDARGIHVIPSSRYQSAGRRRPNNVVHWGHQNRNDITGRGTSTLQPITPAPKISTLFGEFDSLITSSLVITPFPSTNMALMKRERLLSAIRPDR